MNAAGGVGRCFSPPWQVQCGVVIAKLHCSKQGVDTILERKLMVYNKVMISLHAAPDLRTPCEPDPIRPFCSIVKVRLPLFVPEKTSPDCYGQDNQTPYSHLDTNLYSQGTSGNFTASLGISDLPDLKLECSVSIILTNMIG